VKDLDKKWKEILETGQVDLEVVLVKIDLIGKDLNMVWEAIEGMHGRLTRIEKRLDKYGHHIETGEPWGI